MREEVIHYLGYNFVANLLLKLDTDDAVHVIEDLEDDEKNIILQKVPINEREEIKDEFNDSSSNLNAIIAIPQACSESISLHKACHHGIYYDMNYNTSEFLQSLDRIHRVGGSEKNPVFYLEVFGTKDVNLFIVYLKLMISRKLLRK